MHDNPFICQTFLPRTLSIHFRQTLVLPKFPAIWYAYVAIPQQHTQHIATVIDTDNQLAILLIHNYHILNAIYVIH